MTKQSELGSGTALLDERRGKEYVKLAVDGQLFGMAVDMVEDILRQQEIYSIPLAPKEVVGVINLRGRIVTVVDMRVKLGLPEKGSDVQSMNVVVECKGELYSILVDEVFEVIRIHSKNIQHSPENMPECWRQVSDGVHMMQDKLMVLMDVEKLLFFTQESVEEPESE